MRHAGGAALAAALVLVAAGLAAKPATLTVAQMRAYGIEALARGFADQALEVASALLARDPADSGALVLQAQALRLQGHLPESEAAARSAWAAARDPGSRFTAATALAQALSLQDHRSLAQYWLRQAVQNAPSPQARAQAMQDFDYVRSQNPLSLQVDLSIRPSDNVNGGARDPLFEYQGIPFILSGDALALSGLSLGLGLRGGYRLAASPEGQTALTFAASQQAVVLSDAAVAQAPGARASDYTVSHLELGLERRQSLSFGMMTGAVTAGHTWYGGRDLSNSLEGKLTLARPMGGGKGQLDLTVTRQTRLDRPVSSSSEAEIAASLTRHAANGDSWQGNLSLSQVQSRDIGIDHAEATLGLSWQAARPMAGLSLGASVSARGADYAASPYTATGRQDLRLALSLTARVDRIDYLGFSPVVSLDLARNRSNVALYDTQTVGMSLSFTSRF